MRRAFPIIILCLLLVSLSGCALFPSRLHGVEKLAVVQTLGLDREGDGVVLALVTAADSSRGEGPVRMSGRGPTIESAAKDAASRMTEEELFCAHTGHILLGEESAREDVEALLRYVCRSREIRMDVPLLIVRGSSAETALLETGGERVGASEILSALEDSAPARDGGALPSVSQIAARLTEGKSALAAAVKCVPSSEREGEDTPLTLAPAGWAVLKDGKAVAFIEPEEAFAVDLLCGAKGVHELVVTDRRGQRVTLQTAPGSTELRLVHGTDGAPAAIELTMRVSASVLEIDGAGDLSDGDYADELAALLERELLRCAGKVVRLQRSLGADFLSLRERAAFPAVRSWGGDPAALPVRLSASVRVSHANDVRREP